MSLSRERATAYLCGALTDGFAATALIAHRHSRPRAARLAWLASAACGALAVRFEERAQDA